MLAPGVSLNSALLALHNKQAAAVASAGSETIKTEHINETNEKLNKKSKNKNLNNSNKTETLDINNNDGNEHKTNNKPVNSLPKIEETDEFKKFYTFLNSYQQNPHFLSMITAATNANLALPKTSPEVLALQQNAYIQHLIAQQIQSATNAPQINTPTTNKLSSCFQINEKSPESINKKLKCDQQSDESLETEKRIKNFHDLQINQKQNQNKRKSQRKSIMPITQNNTNKSESNNSSDSQQLVPSSSLSSCSSVTSRSSSSISSSSNSSPSSAAPSPPPNQHYSGKQDHIENIVSSNNHADLFTHNIHSTHLQHSMSVPKLHSISSKKPNHFYNSPSDETCLRSNLSHININKSASAFPIVAAKNLNNNANKAANIQHVNMSTPSLGSGGNALSMAVKLKLKNAILQKQDRDKLAKSNSNIHEANNVTRSQNYLHDSLQHGGNFQQSFHPNLNDINENNVAIHHYRHNFNENMKKEQHSFPEPNHHHQQQQFQTQNLNYPKPHDLNLKTANSRQIELITELDENNLRRTNSEPNLKVKSALKDRLIEKRNQQNPFLSKHRPANTSQAASKVSPPPQHLSQLQTIQAQHQMLLANQHQKNFFLPGTQSLSGKHMPTQNEMSHNEQILAAFAQAAALASVQQKEQHLHQQHLQYSNPDFLSLHKQQLAASALLSLSNSQSNLSEEQKVFNLAATLRHLQQQQQQQQNNPAINASPNQHFIDPVASLAILNQNKFLVQPSFSYPMLPNHLMLNMLQQQQNQQHEQSIHTFRESQEALMRPKFGYPVHVEEENEMLLENELKIAAKLNESGGSSAVDIGEGNGNIDRSNENSPNHDENDVIEVVEKSSERSWPNRQLLSSMSTANIIDSQNRLNYRDNQFYRHKLKKDHLHFNSLDQAKELLNKHQHPHELEEYTKRQREYVKSQLSFFSDPYLIKSLESASLNSTADMHNQPYSKKFRRDTLVNCEDSPQAEFSSNMDVAQSEERIYRYTTGIVYDTAMLKHECTCQNPSNHLETADRIRAIWSRFKAKNLIDQCEIVTTKLASISDLLLTHNEHYALIFGSDIEMRPKLPKEYLQTYLMNICLASCKGFALTYDQDNSWNEEYTPIACRVAIGSTYELARQVTIGKLKNGFALVRPPGSHAEFNKPLGFCYFNTVAIVAKMLKKNLLMERILIVDWDVHHGNGTQQMTYNDPNILYISLHRHDDGNFFPGTGSVDECGSEAGLGKNVNIAFNGNLNPPMSDPEYLAAFRCVVMPIAKAFKPQIVLVSCGFDGTENHPKELGGYKVSPMCYGYMTKKLMSLAEGKVVLALEGGYDKQSLCDSSEICLNALTHKQIPVFPSKTLDAMPNKPAIDDLENIIQIQKKYWPSLSESKRYVRMSQNQFISVNTE